MISEPAEAPALERSEPTPQRLALVLPGSGLFDARAGRIAATMRARGHEVVVIARQGRPAGRPRNAIRRVAGAAWGALRQGSAARPALAGVDVAHAMGFLALPVAGAGRRASGPRVLYDARDLYPEARNVARFPAPIRWLVARLERRWARAADAVVTVNPALATRQAAAWGVPPPVVVRNCPPRWRPPAHGSDRLRAMAGLAADAPVALYHGGFSPGRGLEQLRDALRQPGLESVHGIYLGYGPLESELRSWAAEPATRGRLHVLVAVPPDELLATIASADMAVMAIQPDTLNHRLSTPNKLFEAIAAGIPVVASDFPGIREVVDDPAGPLGVLIDPTSPAAIAAGIRSIVEASSERRAALRARCLAAAHERWNWETESSRLIEVYGRLTGRSW
ncbi:MAG TPA: glycosyltransferase [Candidatus Binatus sp.]|nr:glycosyltransferase [Candidatus Binatus sp.]